MYIIHKTFQKPIAPAKDESSKQVAAPTKPSTPVVKPPLTRQISAKNAPVEKPAIPASHAKFTPPKSPFSKKIVTNKSLEQANPPSEPSASSHSQSSKIQNDVQKDPSKSSPKQILKQLPKELPKEAAKELSKQLPKEAVNEQSKDISNHKSTTQSKPVAITDVKVPIKQPLLKQNSVKPIQNPKQIQNNETATKSEPEITQTTETPKLTTEPTTEHKSEINRPINKKFGLTTSKSTETKSAPEKTAPEKVVPSKQVTLKPIPEKTVQSKPASELKTTIAKPELKPIPPKPEPVPEPKHIPTKSALKPIPPKPEAPKNDATKSAIPPPPPPPSGMGEMTN